MKKKTTLGLFLILLSLGSLNAQDRALSFQGTLKNGNANVVYLHSFKNKIFTVIDSAKVKNGRFNFSKKLPLPELYGFSTTKDEIPFYIFLDKGKNVIVYDLESKNNGTVVSGSPSQAIFEEYRQQEKPDITAFIRKYPNEIVSAYLLYREWSYRLTPEELEANIALLSPVQQQSRYIKDLHNIIAVARTVAVGKKAPAIVGNSPEGEVLSLYDNLGKYTLVDFWASWCPPCRKENPNIVANYQKYKDKGFQIFAVSLDKTKAAWLKGIKDDNLTWHHVSELKYWDSAIAGVYAVRSIPSNFLIDDKGTIIAKNVRGPRLGQVLDSLFNTTSIGRVSPAPPKKNLISDHATILSAVAVDRKRQ